MGTHSGPNAELWFGKRVKSDPGTELGPDRRGQFGKVSQTHRYFTYEWWFGHHMDRNGRGEFDTDTAAGRRAGFGTRKATKDSAGDRKKRAQRDYAAYCHERFQAAEKATNGHMVTPAGRAKGYTGSDFFDPDARRRPSRKWATDELRAWLGDSDTAAGGHGSRGGVLSFTAYTEQTQEKAA